MLIMMIPFLPTHEMWHHEAQQEMVEEIQETSNPSNNLLEEENKLVKIWDYRFDCNILDLSITSAKKFYILDECLHKHLHFKELIQPPNAC